MGLFEPVFQALDTAGVRYVTVGGVAVVLHGHVRLTRDIDLVVDLDHAEALKAVRALTAAGFAPVAPVPAEQFADAEVRRAWARDKQMVVFSMRNERGELYVDLFIDYPVDWRSLWRDSETIAVSDTLIRVASIEHLIAMKLASDRPRDREDVAQLRALKHLKDGAG